jgi:topoisomerase-4 subunit A
MASSSTPAPAGEIRHVRFVDALEERYLAYALSTIMARSLPDVRDGLKPVHRRLLYAMRQLRLTPDQGFKKSARVVGDVIGKFHPHGDQSIYDALVRLAQDFSLRFPLIDGQGNFGNIDGDNAAAMRYTEARLTEVASALLDGIDEDTVDFRATYDGDALEPEVLPASFPNLLANGAQGIAVGMATAIPPHNVGEVCDALLHMIKYPKATAAKLSELIPGPDFPTGGVLVEDHGAVVEAYKTGRGSFRVRARWEVEKQKGGAYQIVVTEIPDQVQKSRLVERIAELLQARKLAMLADVRDESAADLRLVLEPKSRNVEAEVLMESLFRQTDLETRVSLNMNVLDADHTPRVMSLGEVLQAFLDHRHEVLQRRSQHWLDKIDKRLEVLDGYLIAYLNLDEVIRIIRYEDEPKSQLMTTFELSDDQAEAILNMRLRALRKLEEEGIRKEHAGLTDQRKELKRLLKSEPERWRVIATEIKELKKQFGPASVLGARRTELGSPPADVVVPIEAVIEREPVTVLCSAKGWIRAIRQIARRARLRRALAAPLRPTQRPGRGRDPGPPVGREAAGGLGRRARLRRTGGRGGGPDQEWQAGPQLGQRPGSRGLRPGRRRFGRRHRRESQAADFPPVGAPRHDPRPRRHSAALPRRRPQGHQDLRPEGGPHLAGRRRADPHRDRPHRLDRQAQRGRPAAAPRLPQVEQIRLIPAFSQQRCCGLVPIKTTSR